MKLLYWTDPEEVDELLMVVPDDYDMDLAANKAEEHLAGAELENWYHIETDAIMPDRYRPFVG